MSQIKDLEQLKEKVEQLKEKRNRAEGRLEEAQERLKEEFGVNSLRAAEKLLKQLAGEEETAREEFETALEEFNDEWGDKLDE